jgi:competence ComEA-like helix-hairpin-helix protein
LSDQSKRTEKKININIASEYELSMNPNISRDIAKAIIIYRNQHGNYQKIEDLKKIVFINEEMFRKIAPYLTVDP